MRIVTFVDDKIMTNIKELYKDSDKTISKIIAELVDIGYRVKQHQQTQLPNQKDNKIEENDPLIFKHSEYLLRIMAVVADIYRCTRNEKSKYKETIADDALNTIVINTQKFINKKA